MFRSLLLLNHPAEAGAIAMRRMWANAIIASGIYSDTTTVASILRSSKVTRIPMNESSHYDLLGRWLGWNKHQ